MVANDVLFELVNALDCVSTTLSEMSRVLEAQRHAVAMNDLPGLLAVTSEQEELTARLERCERRRQHAQVNIERELDVIGVRAIVASLPDTLQFRVRLAELVEEIGPKVQALHEHSQRSSQLLKSSIEHAQRSRTYLLRLGRNGTHLRCSFAYSMTSTFFGLDLALRAIHAQQTGLDVTNHNVANANTNGYSRQRVNIAATTPFSEPGLNRPGGAGQVGTGAVAESIRRYRDIFLDLQYRTEIGAGAQAQVTQDALEEIEVVLNEPSDTGISNLLQEFFQSWQDLSNNPTEGAAHSTVVQQATALAQAFNRASTRLTAVQTDLNNQVSERTQEINSITSQIDVLNRQIVQVEVTGQNANDHRDSRDRLLDDLAKLVPISVVENPNGSVNVSVNGHNLVSAGNLETLTLTPTGPGGMSQVRFGSDSALVNLTAGELKGLIDTRDLNVPNYLSQLDTIVGNMITAVNAVHTPGYGLDNVNGRAFFTGTNAATIAVNAALVADPQRVATATAANQPGDSSIALAIAQLRTTMAAPPESAYASLITTLGVDSRSAQDKATNQGTLLQLLSRRKEDVSGVSLDEEATNMIKYQRAYEAAARLLTAFDEMLDTLINRTGVVGR